MASRAPHPEAPRPRVPASRHRAWLFAITAWAGFLGAILTLLVAIALLPDGTQLGWGEISVAFLCGWLSSMVAVALALMLALPLAARGPGHGR